jgi:hypothetical protein
MEIERRWQPGLKNDGGAEGLFRHPPYSHSIIFLYRNPLNSVRKFFPPTVKTRSPSRQNFLLLISKGNLRDSDFARLRPLSLSIGRFSTNSKENGAAAPVEKNTVNVCITVPPAWKSPLNRVHAPGQGAARSHLPNLFEV